MIDTAAGDRGVGARPRTFVYRLDSQDRISYVDDEWVSFARENGAPALTREGVLGESIWTFVHDLETRHLYRAVFERLRAGTSMPQLPFRCDSPDRRRFMQMDLRVLPDDAIELRSLLLREEARRPAALLDDSVPRSDDLLRMCSSCKQVALPSRWLEVEEAIAELDLFGESVLPRITHGMCPACIELFFPQV